MYKFIQQLGKKDLKGKDRINFDLKQTAIENKTVIFKLVDISIVFYTEPPIKQMIVCLFVLNL